MGLRKTLELQAVTSLQCHNLLVAVRMMSIMKRHPLLCHRDHTSTLLQRGADLQGPVEGAPASEGGDGVEVGMGHIAKLVINVRLPCYVLVIQRGPVQQELRTQCVCSSAMHRCVPALSLWHRNVVFSALNAGHLHAAVLGKKSGVMLHIQISQECCTNMAQQCEWPPVAKHLLWQAAC